MNERKLVCPRWKISQEVCDYYCDYYYLWTSIDTFITARGQSVLLEWDIYSTIPFIILILKK